MLFSVSDFGLETDLNIISNIKTWERSKTKMEFDWRLHYQFKIQIPFEYLKILSLAFD